MTTIREYKSDLAAIAENLAHPDIDLEIAATAKRHGKPNGAIYHDLQAYYPLQWRAAGGQDVAQSAGISGFASGYSVTEGDVIHIKETDFLYKQILPRGHLIALVGLPSAGKSTVMEHIAAQLPGKVYYINVDISAGDIPEAWRRAQAGGYELLCPDIKPGKSVADLVKGLERMAQSGDDLAGVVFIIDTLKKIVSVINKTSASTVYKMLRALTGRGATVICLAHCNKYPDPDGWPVYEGTADLRSDFDELGLMHAHKGDYGTVTVSLYWDQHGWPSGKTRALLQVQSWLIDREDNRSVVELPGWIDTVQLSKEFHQALQTADVIREIYHLLLKHGPMTQSDIFDRLAGIHGQHVLRRVLKRQQDKTWTIKQGENNAHIHTAIPGADVPKPKEIEWGKK